MFDKLNIVRDCYWAMPSGIRYLHNEDGKLSSHVTGLYTSLNSNDDKYIIASDSGNMRYYGRLEHTNVNTNIVHTTLRASCVPDGSAVLSINNYQMCVVPVSGGIHNYEYTTQLNDQQYDRIHYGRIDKNYDYFDVRLESAIATPHTWRTPDFWLNSQGIYPHIDTSFYPSYNGSGVITDGDRVGAWASSGTAPCLMFNDDGAEYKPIYSATAVAGRPGVRFWNGSGLFLQYWWSDNANERRPKILTGVSGEIYIIAQKEKTVDTTNTYWLSMEDQSPTEDTYWRIGLTHDPESPVVIAKWASTNLTYSYATNAVGDLPSGVPVMVGAHTYGGVTIHHTIDGSGVPTVLYSDNYKRKWWSQFTPTVGYGTYCLGGQWGGFSPSDVNFEFDGYIAEVLAYNTPLSSGERLALFTYINETYGLGTAYVPPSMKLLDLEIYYSGSNTWDNHQTGLPNVITKTFDPIGISVPVATRWSGSFTDIADSGDPDVDDTYLEFNGSDSYIAPPFYGNPKLRQIPAKEMPSGYLSISFNQEDVNNFTQITRARLNVRMSLPLASGDNKRDTFEVNGYNPYYKNKDHREDLEYVNASQIPRTNRYGYYIYGAGSIVEQSGFQTYGVELNFLNPSLPSGNYSSTREANSDMLANMEFQFIGLPSGTRMSAAQLQVEYLNDDFLPMYTIGSNRIRRCAASGVIDAGTFRSYSAGHGGWQHVGWRLRGPTVIEEDVFTNFYTFSEGPGHTRTYPETCKAYYFPTGDEDSTVYADYLIYAPRDESDVTPLLKDPQRREYYRNPISAADLTPAYESTPRDIAPFKPHYYRHMIYHGASLDYVDVEPGDGDLTRLASDDLCQIYFADRIGFTEDFTLYFAIYRDYGFQSYGRFFHRGLLKYENINDYEIYGDLEPNLVRFTVQGANGTDNRVEVEINQYTKEPILIWFTCGYDKLTGVPGMTTMTLNVHQDTKNYFGQDWIRTQRSFVGHRKQYSANTETVYRPDGTPYVITWGGPRTVLGTLDIINVYQQMSRRLYLHHASPVEFGYANDYIDLDYTTSSSTTQSGYDTSDEKDKFFLRTRLCNSQYLRHNPSGVRWVVPYGSGEAYWSTTYNAFESWEPSTVHSIFNPISTAGTNHIVHPSAVYVELDLAHSTDHPSGLTVYVDVEFDSGTSDNWKVAHTALENIPSGGSLWFHYVPIKYTTQTDQHINMDGGPIRWSDVSNINVTLTTKYPGNGEQPYHGNVEVRALRVYLDAYCIATTGVNDIPLYIKGTAQTLNEPRLDLYIVGHETISTSPNDLDLYIRGVALQASGEMPLYTHGIPSPIIPPDYDGACPLFIEGLDPPDASGSFDMFVWGTVNPAMRQFGTLFTHSTLDPNWMLPLVMNGAGGDTSVTMPLFLGNYVPKVTNLPSGLSMYIHGPTQTTDSMNLYINTPSGTEGWFIGRGSTPLYIDRETESTAGRLGLFLENRYRISAMDTFIQGAIVSPSSIPFYISGSGAPPSKQMKIFISGY